MKILITFGCFALFILGMIGFAHYIAPPPKELVESQTHAFFQKIATGQENSATVAYIVDKLTYLQYPTAVKKGDFLDEAVFDAEYKEEPTKIMTLRHTIVQAWVTSQFNKTLKADPGLEPFLDISKRIMTPGTNITLFGEKTTGIQLDLSNLWPSMSMAQERIEYACWLRDTWKDVVSDPKPPHVDAAFQKKMDLIKIIVHEEKDPSGKGGKQLKYLSVLSFDSDELQRLPDYEKVRPYIKNF